MEDRTDACSNRHDCSCPKEDCRNRAVCCACVANHAAQGNLPFCLR